MELTANLQIYYNRSTSWKVTFVPEEKFGEIVDQGKWYSKG